MTEKEARAKIVKLAESYLGAKQGGAMHKKIIDTFNKVKPDGWSMTYSAYWCAAFASAIAILYLDVKKAEMHFPLSANCGTIINKAQAMNIWKEDDKYTPQQGDWILYDWEDDGKGDNKGGPNHVGIVRKVKDKVIYVIEGNKNKAVGERQIAVNGRYIRGFVIPKYGAIAKEFTKAEKKTVKKTEKKTPSKQTLFSRKLAFVAAYAYKNKFKYDHTYSHCGTSWKQAKKTKKMNCHLLVNFALQLMGVLKAGQVFWLNGTRVACKGTGTKTAVKKAFKITHPKAGPSKAKLKKMDVCGYEKNAHTQVYAGRNKSKQPIWYSWGPSDVRKDLPRHKKSYDSKKIMTKMRLK